MSAIRLSIVIPTILRSSVIQTVNNCLTLCAGYNVEIVVGVNPLNLYGLEEQSVLSSLLNIPGLQVKIQNSPKETAEASAFASIEFAKGEWILFLGDDDELDEKNFEEVFDLLDFNVDFWLLNCNLLYSSGFRSPYYTIGPEPRQVSSGLDLFKKFGLVTATTTLSCLLFKKESVDLNLFQRIESIQGIYSHSFFLFCNFASRMVGATNTCFINRKEASSIEVGAALSRYASNLGIPSTEIFTLGLYKLVEFASRHTGLEIGEILSFRELEIFKDVKEFSLANHKVHVTTLGGFISEFVQRSDYFDTRITRLEHCLYEQGFEKSGDHLILDAPVRVTLPALPGGFSCP